jgi:magnesium and cobalt transporter
MADMPYPAMKKEEEPPAAAPEPGRKPSWISRLLKPKSEEDDLREAIEEYIETHEDEDSAPDVVHEKTLIGNVLKMRDLRVWDVMIPRADIAAIHIDASQEELMELLSERQFSRIPVYRETLDDVIGSIHIKDILACVASKKPVVIRDLVRDVPIVAPGLPVMDLLLHMRQSRKHMMLAVDEFGGVDGLVTIGDVIEAIVGEVEDEFDNEEQPRITVKPDGSLLADARYDIEEFEETYGAFLTSEEREEVDTLGGLVFSLAGRVPARGEIIAHQSGMTFEVVDADPRRVNVLRIKNIPAKPAAEE